MAVHGDRYVRCDAQPVGHAAGARRVERWQRGGRRRRARGRGTRLRRRGLDTDPGRVVRPIRPQATEGAGLDGAAATGVARPLGQRRAVPPRRRHRPLSRRRLRRHRHRPGQRAGTRDPLRPGRRHAARTTRIAYSKRIPPGVISSLSADVERALAETVDLLRSLGHDVSEHDPEYGLDAIPAVLARYLRGVHDDAAELAHPERLERRTRGMARMGGLITRRCSNARSRASRRSPRGCRLS